MVFFKIEYGVGNKKRQHFVSAVIKGTRAPTRVFFAIFLRRLVKRRTVEFVQTERILRKMRRHPIQNHPDSRAVERVYKRHEIVRRTETRRNGIIARHLIPPRTVEGKFGNGHKFHVRIAHLLHIRHKRRSQFFIRTERAVVVPLPGEKIHFVNIYGRRIDIRMRKTR